jgi:hypothetical protein
MIAPPKNTGSKNTNIEDYLEKTVIRSAGLLVRAVYVLSSYEADVVKPLDVFFS